MKRCVFKLIRAVHFGVVIQKNLYTNVGAETRNRIINSPSPPRYVRTPLPYAKESFRSRSSCRRLRHTPEEPSKCEQTGLIDTSETSCIRNPERWSQRNRLPQCILKHCNTPTTATNQCSPDSHIRLASERRTCKLNLDPDLLEEQLPALGHCHPLWSDTHPTEPSVHGHRSLLSNSTLISSFCESFVDRLRSSSIFRCFNCSFLVVLFAGRLFFGVFTFFSSSGEGRSTGTCRSFSCSSAKDFTSGASPIFHRIQSQNAPILV